jgi:hypothetical protein
MSNDSKVEHLVVEPVNEHELRVFISYSHEDKAIARTIASVLKKNGITATYDKKGMHVGSGFPQQIINYVSHAHIFMPLLTKTSLKRPWVQQEIGYAVASRVTTVPVAINCEPGEFLYGIQAIHLKTVDKAKLEKRLTRKTLDTCLQETPLGGALYECGAMTEDRARLLAQYAHAVTLMGGAGVVRQSGGLSSFHIPDAPIDDPLWELRYGKQHQSDAHKAALREERLALTEHAKLKGCRIIIDPDLNFKFYGGDARRTRLQCLLRFLQDETIPSCQVAIAHLPINESITIVGDWFVAHSISSRMGQGYRHTIFTRHAPTIARMISDFEQSFGKHLNGMPEANSREHAIAEIKSRIAAIPVAATKAVRSKR